MKLDEYFQEALGDVFNAAKARAAQIGNAAVQQSKIAAANIAAETKRGIAAAEPYVNTPQVKNTAIRAGLELFGAEDRQARGIANKFYPLSQNGNAFLIALKEMDLIKNMSDADASKLSDQISKVFPKKLSSKQQILADSKYPAFCFCLAFYASCSSTSTIRIDDIIDKEFSLSEDFIDLWDRRLEKKITGVKRIYSLSITTDGKASFPKHHVITIFQAASREGKAEQDKFREIIGKTVIGYGEDYDLLKVTSPFLSWTVPSDFSVLLQTIRPHLVF